MEPHRGMGNAKDKLDSACRRYENCLQCAKIENSNCHADRAYKFLADTNEFGENEFECTNSLDGGEEEKWRCK